MLVIFEFAMAWGSYYGGYRRRYSRRRSYPRRMYSAGRSRYRAPARRRAAPKRKTITRKSRKCACPQKDLTPGDKFLLAQADPFEPKCLGAKIPDSNTVPSVAAPLTELYSLTTTAAGDGKCVAFLPSVNSSIIASTAASSTSWTWATFASGTGVSNWTKVTDFRATFEASRPVAHGIRITCNNAPTTTTGYVHVAVAFEAYNNVTTWPFATDIAGLSGYSWYKRVTLASLTQSPLTVINKYCDETAFRYSGADTAGVSNATPMEFHIPYSWGAILIAVEGAATTTPIQCEMILHSEGIPKQQAFLVGSNAAPYSPAVLGATSHMVANTDFTHTEAEQGEYISTALGTALQQGASGAVSAAVQNIAIPAARQVGYNLAGRAISMGVAGLASLAGIGGVNNNPERLSLTR